MCPCTSSLARHRAWVLGNTEQVKHFQKSVLFWMGNSFLPMSHPFSWRRKSACGDHPDHSTQWLEWEREGWLLGTLCCHTLNQTATRSYGATLEAFRWKKYGLLKPEASWTWYQNSNSSFFCPHQAALSDSQWKRNWVLGSHSNYSVLIHLWKWGLAGSHYVQPWLA